MTWEERHDDAYAHDEHEDYLSKFNRRMPYMWAAVWLANVLAVVVQVANGQWWVLVSANFLVVLAVPYMWRLTRKYGFRFGLVRGE